MKPKTRRKTMGMYTPPTDGMNPLRSPMLDTNLREASGTDVQPFKQTAADQGELDKGTRRRRTRAFS